MGKSINVVAISSILNMEPSDLTFQLFRSSSLQWQIDKVHVSTTHQQISVKVRFLES